MVPPFAVATHETIGQLIGILSRDSIPLLDSAGELIAPEVELTLWTMGQPVPLFPHAPAELLPLAFEAFTVHISFLSLLVHEVWQAGSWR